MKSKSLIKGIEEMSKDELYALRASKQKKVHIIDHFVYGNGRTLPHLSRTDMMDTRYRLSMEIGEINARLDYLRRTA